MAIIAATLNRVVLLAEVTSKGLKGSSIELQAIPSEHGVIEGVSANTRNKEMPCVWEASMKYL